MIDVTAGFQEMPKHTLTIHVDLQSIEAYLKKDGKKYADYTSWGDRGTLTEFVPQLFMSVGGGIKYYPTQASWWNTGRHLGDLLTRYVDTYMPDFGKLLNVYFNEEGCRKNQVHIEIEGNVDTIAVPFELLLGRIVDETRTEQKGSKHPKETPLVAEYPFFRRILVNPGQKKPPKVSTLYSKNPKDWQVLIIKSDVWGDVKIGNDSDSPRYWVDKLADISDEIKTLRDTFPHIEVIPKWPDGFVTWEEVAKRLMEKQWDVVHFAGHGFYLYNAGERLGGIVLSESRNSNKPVGILTGTIEEVITQCPGIVLAYLSSCEGAMTDGKIRNQVFYSSFNGVVGSLLRGCGSVIAYRWPVSDKGACKLALNFYQRLAPKPGQGERQTIESALQQARWHVHSNEESENIWASAVLAFCPYSKGEK